MTVLHPPIHLLKAFACAAQTLNVSRAAEQLHLSQSTVSKQILELERMLRSELFHRVNNRLQLAPAGQQYLAAVQEILQQLESATLKLMTREHSDSTVRLSCLPTLASKWLVPRLPDFASRHPLISIECMPHRLGYDFSLPELECAIRYGQGDWPGSEAFYLLGREVSVIASGQQTLQAPLTKLVDVRRHTLLHHLSEPLAWLNWGVKNKLSLDDPTAGPKFDQVGPMVSAVSAGWGLGLVPSCLIEQEIKLAVLQAPFGTTFPSDSGYYFCYPQSQHTKPAVLTFKHWLLTQAVNL